MYSPCTDPALLETAHLPQIPHLFPAAQLPSQKFHPVFFSLSNHAKFISSNCMLGVCKPPRRCCGKTVSFARPIKMDILTNSFRRIERLHGAPHIYNYPNTVIVALELLCELLAQICSKIDLSWFKLAKMGNRLRLTMFC